MTLQEAKLSEAQIQRQILDWLAAEGIFSIRFNTGAVKMGQRFVRFGTAGCADILACPQGRPPVWIEVKSATGRQRLEQRSFQNAVELAGHTYTIVRSLEDVQEVLG